MKKTILLSASLLSLTSVGALAENVANPILQNVADIGVMKYNGKYYLGGCRTDGDFYISSDLINWEGPIHVIDMDNDWSKGSGCGNNQIHANDMLYDNGTIHAYWSVNYWGKDLHAVHVVHSEASDPMGPYTEPVKDRWMDNRIDPKVFRDDDGQLYMYMVRFTDGNTIWARKMDNWREFNLTDPDAFVCQFASLPNTWERMDNAVAEGPWVIKYHGQYYMMYNANHTGGEWGNYQLGVAQATSPMGFNNGNKYSHPVVLSNQKALEDDHVDLLRYSTGTYAPLFSYLTTTPPQDWTLPGFDDSKWQKGSGGFAPSAVRGSTTYRRGTNWTSESIALRKPFKLADTSHNLALRLTANGPTKVYLNGKEILAEDHGCYKVVNFTPEMAKQLKAGDNLLAVESNAKGRRGYINVELFDMGSEKADPVIVWTPGQPNILRGPNGLEWWLIYMANVDGIGRHQFVDRVHFHGDKIVVDGITHPGNPGFHPQPALPAYGDNFDSDKLDTSNWDNIDATRWTVAGGELKATPSSTARLAPALAANSYLWEVNVKPEATSGVYAVWVDDNNNVAVKFDKATNSLDIIQTLNGSATTLDTVALRDDFRWDAYHQIRVERDFGDLSLKLDEMEVLPTLTSEVAAVGVPGLIAGPKGASFDGIIYTIGFDDGNDYMNDWNVTAGSLTPTQRGASASGQLKAFKGKPSTSYEFVTQISGLADNAVAGVYPLYIDEKNYVEAILDAPARQLVVKTVKKGKTIKESRLPVDCMRTLYTDARFTDSFDKGYVMDCPTTFDAIYLKRYDIANRNVFTESRFDKDTETVGDKEIFVDNMFDIVAPSMVAPDGSWLDIPTANVGVDANPAYNVAKFEPLTGRQLRFINRQPTDGAHHIYDIRLHELFKDSYNLRAVREGDTLHLLLDGRQMAEIPVKDFGKSGVGLVAEQGTPEYHGVTYYNK